jgi:hypothetical protein
MWNRNGGPGARTVVRGVRALDRKRVYPPIPRPRALRSKIDTEVAGNLPVRRRMAAPGANERFVTDDRGDLAGYGWARGI